MLKGSPSGTPVLLGIETPKCPAIEGYLKVRARKFSQTVTTAGGTPNKPSRNRMGARGTALKKRLRSIEKPKRGLASRMAPSTAISTCKAVSLDDLPGKDPRIPGINQVPQSWRIGRDIVEAKYRYKVANTVLGLHCSTVCGLSTFGTNETVLRHR